MPVSLSMGAQWALWLMAQRPERVLGSVFIGPSLDLVPGYQGREQPFEEPYTSTEGWAKYNRHYWLDHYQDFLEFFFSQCFIEPHSTKPVEDAVGWGLETSAQVLIAESNAPWVDEATLRAWCAASRCPVLVITGPRTGSARCGGPSGWPRRPAAPWSSWRAPATSPWPATRSR